MNTASDNGGDRLDPVEQLLEEARSGSTEALGRLFETYRAYLLKIANDHLPDDLRAKGGASDLVQQSFLRALQGFDRFKGDNDGELKAWLRQILLNGALNLNRQYRNAEMRDVRRELTLEEGSTRNPAQEIRDVGPSPSSHFGRHQSVEQLKRALQQLPEDYRQVLELRYWQRLSFGEISRLMNRSPNAVRKLWLRAIERLPKELN